MMPDDPFARFLVFFLAGAGLLLAGSLNLLLLHAPKTLRFGSTFALPAVALAYLSTETDYREPTAIASVLIFGSIGLAYVLGQNYVRHLESASLRWGMMAALGLAAVMVSARTYEQELTDEVDRAMEEMENVQARPRVRLSDRVFAATDRGTPIPLLEPISPRSEQEIDAFESRALRNTFDRQIIRRQPGGDHCNCHGWVFTGGKFAIASEIVDTILNDNDYRAVDHPLSGDLALYGRGGYRTHTAIVRYVSPEMPVMVEGKWGSGSVYLHTVDQYGSFNAYYRSQRGGHLLAGCGGPSVTPPDKITVDERTE